jgi:hypothetical protein
MKLIQLDWEGPYKLKELTNLMKNSVDYGLYQIYGRHPLYGNAVLLYIGKADKQTLGKRILQENWHDTNDSQNLTIYIGRCAGDKTPDEETWSNEIDLAERLLIHVHKPAYNSKSLYKIPMENLNSIHILNWGDHCSLYPEISGLRWTNKLDELDYDIYRAELVES